MISVSKLLCDTPASGDGLRYDAADETDIEQVRERKQQRPVVVWNVTKGCNLACQHCYAEAEADRAPGELSTEEGEHLLDELAAYDVPVVLFSGGEPLVRQDLEHLVGYASDCGIRPVLSTNGTLITPKRARKLKTAGLQYAGVSVDGLPERNDEFRGCSGAFDAAVEGIEACLDAGLKTGLRYTVTEANRPDLEGVVDLLHDVGLDRFCFYHLDYGGRGAGIQDVDLSTDERRRAVEAVCDLTLEYHAQGDEIETLLVGNYCDAAFIVEYAREHLDVEADRIYDYLRVNGGDPTGERVADIDYQGNVHLTQFWQGYSLGNVRDRPFGRIWDDDSNLFLKRLRERERHLDEQCQRCQYEEVCRGGSRLRALAVHGDPFAPDPQCYLTPAERGVGGADSAAGAD